MSDLTEFLLARVAEDEWDARRALGLDLAVRLKGQAAQVVSRHGSPDPPDEPNAADRLWWTAQDVVQWLTPYGPARILAECEAKRRIVKEFAQVHADYRIAHTPTLEGQRLGLVKALTALALPYAEHPDYREEWRP